MSNAENIHSNTTKVRKIAKELGFESIGISKAQRLDSEEQRLADYLSNGFNGNMSYMENYFEKRLDPRALVPGSKSVISLMYNYYSEKKQLDEEAPKLSKYAYGYDYHFIIKDKLKLFIDRINEEIGLIDGRMFTDSAPVLEKAWAAKSGLGWRGKNTLLINKSYGSYYFLAELILDMEFEYDSPLRDRCGNCTKCIDACPTDALSPAGYILDGSKCISYLTIELKDDLSNQFKGKMENWMFGCDICQDVCPWNRFAYQHSEPLFLPSDKLLEMSKRDWEEITQEVFSEIFRKSPVKRAKYRGLKRNIDFLKQ